MRLAVVPAAVLSTTLALTNCQKPAATTPPIATLPPVKPPPPPEDPCAHPQVMGQVMQCKLSPYMGGKTGDETAFRYALGQLRDMAPPDSNYNQGERPWFAIVDDMLKTREYKRGCQECHQHYKKPYQARYDGTAVVWQDPQGAAPAGKP
jgi:hypothetical protein